MSNKFAPIALFAYNRLNHLKKLINSLKKNELSKDSIIYIFSDGWKSLSDKNDVEAVRKYLKKIKIFKKITIIERSKNLGLSKNIISGVSEILKKYKSVIVIEDDLILDRFFLKYLNEGLRIYRTNKFIASIHGYNYPIQFNTKVPDYFLIKGADCWGWGTWRRAWRKFEKDGLKLKKIIDKKNLKKEFNFNDSYNYYQMLTDQIANKNDSWAIRWYASAFINNMFTLYPAKSFVKNIGDDGTGTHGSGSRNVNGKLTSYKKFIPIDVKKINNKENINARKQIEFYFNNKYDLSFKKILKKILKWNY